MKRLKAILLNSLVMVGAIIVTLAICELGARMFLSPADYLGVAMVRDDLLGAVPSRASKAGGFDVWGFRNREVPETADIVAIGDSQTYGNTVTMDDSWPYVVGRSLGKRVYNMGLGGYGPNQYLHLMETRALALNPETIVVGLSMTDDFENAFLITYGLEHWAHLGRLKPYTVNPDIWWVEPAVTWHKRLRLWLSSNSVMYQILFHGPVLGRLQGELQLRFASRISDSVVSLDIPEKGIQEAFRPEGVLRNLDQHDPTVQEGMRITFELLRQMDERCRREGIELVVAIIPTKEMVFSDYLEHNPSLHLSGTLDRLVENERAARDKTFTFLKDASIAYVDILPAMKQAVGQQLYNRTATDMHPNPNGYRVYANAVTQALTQAGASLR